MIGRILHLGLNELRLTAKERANFFWMLAMPLIFILFFGTVMGGGSSGPSDANITLTVVDNDVSWLSRALMEALEGEDFTVTEVAPGKLEEVERRIRTLVIPEGMAEKVARGEQVTLFLAPEPNANEGATMVAEIHIFRALTRLIGSMVEMSETQGPEGVLDLQVDRLEEFRRLAAREPLVRIETGFAGRGRPVPEGFGQAVPGMMTQFILMMVIIAGAVYLTEEKLSGVLRRLAVAPFTPRTLIAGKVTGMVMLALVQAGFLILCGSVIGRFRLFGAEFYWGDSPAGLALMVLAFAIAVAGITLFFGAVISTPAQAGAVGWLSGMIMAGLGGCWWPLEVVPSWLRTAGHIFPTAWMMDGLHELISFGRGVDAVLLEASILLGYGVLFGLLGARFLKIQS
jgi:ABC-type multidrug transport system permease subunit